VVIENFRRKLGIVTEDSSAIPGLTLNSLNSAVNANVAKQQAVEIGACRMKWFWNLAPD
jgi:hypothetical protein